MYTCIHIYICRYTTDVRVCARRWHSLRGLQAGVASEVAGCLEVRLKSRSTRHSARRTCVHSLRSVPRIGLQCILTNTHVIMCLGLYMYIPLPSCWDVHSARCRDTEKPEAVQTHIYICMMNAHIYK